MCVEEYEQVRRSNREIFETKARAKTKKKDSQKYRDPGLDTEPQRLVDENRVLPQSLSQ